MSKFIDEQKGVKLSKEDMDSLKHVFDLAGKIDKAGFVVHPGTVAFCPVAWFVAETAVALAHLAIEESWIGLDVAAQQKVIEGNAGRLKEQLTALETKSHKSGVEILSKLKENMNKNS